MTELTQKFIDEAISKHLPRNCIGSFEELIDFLDKDCSINDTALFHREHSRAFRLSKINGLYYHEIIYPNR